MDVESKKHWICYRMFCLNCGNGILGCKNKRGEIKYKCERCGCELIRQDRSRRHATVEVYAPADQVCEAGTYISF